MHSSADYSVVTLRDGTEGVPYPNFQVIHGNLKVLLNSGENELIQRLVHLALGYIELEEIPESDLPRLKELRLIREDDNRLADLTRIVVINSIKFNGYTGKPHLVDPLLHRDDTSFQTPTATTPKASASTSTSQPPPTRKPRELFRAMSSLALSALTTSRNPSTKSTRKKTGLNRVPPPYSTCRQSGELKALCTVAR